MNIQELKKKLDEAAIPENWYNLTGEGRTDSRYVLEHNGNRWAVYYRERRARNQERVFHTEDDACAYLAEKLLKSDRDFITPLPLGTVVRLHGGKMKLMVVSRALRVPSSNGESYYFDYGAVAYPNGLVTPEMAYFQQENVEEVYHWGYADEDDKRVLDSIHYFLLSHPEIKRGTVDDFK